MSETSEDPIERLFHEALAQPADQRANFVRNQCKGDRSLEEGVLDLVHYHEMSGGPLPDGHRDKRQPARRYQNDQLVAGRYTIIELLGKGGMGEVYKARDVLMGLEIALKTISTDLEEKSHSAQLRKQFIETAKLARSLEDPHICKLFDVQEDKATPDAPPNLICSMKLLEGETLHQTLEVPDDPNAARRQPYELVRAIGAGIGRALTVAHAGKVIHGDLKPANVMLTHPGGSTMAVVMDFGLATLQRDPSETRTLSRNPPMPIGPGTPKWMSPEQWSGKRADTPSDIYALGLMLYQMTTGSMPFEFDSERAQKEAPDPKLKAPDLPGDLETVIRGCLAKNVEQRPNAEKIVEALSTGLPLAPPPLRIPFRSKVAIAVAFCLVAMIGIWVGLKYYLRPDPVTVAVLPLEVPDGSETLSVLGDILVEGLAARLAEGDRVTVPDENSVRQSLKARQSAGEVAKRLGMRKYLTGAIRKKESSSIELSMTLHDRSNGKTTDRVFTAENHSWKQIEDSMYRWANGELGFFFAPSEGVLGGSNNLEAEKLYQRARQQMRVQKGPEDIRTSIKLYEQAIQTDKSSGGTGYCRALAGLANAHVTLALQVRNERQGNLDAGREYASQATALCPKLADGHVALGTVLTTAREFGRAETELNAALKLAPESEDVYRRRGSLYAQRNQDKQDRDRAVAYFEKAAQINPDNPNNFYQLGKFRFENGSNDKARDAFRNVIALNENDPLGWEGLGGVYQKDGHFREAIAEFEQAKILAPKPLTISNLGTCYFYSGDVTKALQLYRQSVALSPDREVTHGNLADALRESGMTVEANLSYAKAISLCQRDLKQAPNNAAKRRNLALYFAKTGNDAQALTEICAVRNANREDAELLFNEAEVHAIAGRYADAMSALSEAVKLGFSTAYIKADPDLRKLRGLPGFEDIVSGKSRASLTPGEQVAGSKRCRPTEK